MLLNCVVQFNYVVELCCGIVLLNCVEKFNCVVENLVGRRKEKKKNKLFILFYNEECKAICLSSNHEWKWPHGWRRFNL